jgi:4-carboxymuconolactone decarboxylase
MAELLPQPFVRFTRDYAAVARAYDALGKVCAEAGPLDEKTRELIKLGMAIGGRLEGAVHAHARRALAAGASPEEVRHVVAMAVPTVGFPTTVAAFTWVDDVLAPKGKKNGRRLNTSASDLVVLLRKGAGQSMLLRKGAGQSMRRSL